MKLPLLLAVMLLVPLGCGDFAPDNLDPQEVASQYMTRIVDQSGKLDGLELVDPPAVISEYSSTSLPSVDWDNVVAAKPRRPVFRGPGPSQELARYKFDYILSYGQMPGTVLIDVGFDIELKDGTSAVATLSLRPADDGTLKIVPPAE